MKNVKNLNLYVNLMKQKREINMNKISEERKQKAPLPNILKQILLNWMIKFRNLAIS